MIKTCVICGSTFQGKKRQTSCSDECKHERHLAMERAYYAKHSKPKILKHCVICGEPFTTTQDSRTITCSPKCSHENSNIRSREYHRKVRNYQKEHSTRCVECGKEFQTNRPYQKLCSDKCRKTREARRQRQCMSIKPASRQRPKPKLSILEVSRLAKEAGMSYGEYVARYGV